MKPPDITESQNSVGMSIKTLFTLVFLKRDHSVLLGYKTRGLGMGLWNGFGGKLERDENLTHCAHREVAEECSVIVDDLKHVGVVRYEVEQSHHIHIVHIFTASSFQGNEAPSEEMNPVKWYNYGDIPYESMWPDSVKWYPLMLEDKYFSAHVIYSSDHLISKAIIEEYGSITSALKLAQ